MEQPPSKETRVPVNLRIKFRSETIEQFVERYAVDVSRGGIFIRTREPLAVGTQLKFDFQLQNTSPLMAGEGTVVWIREHDPDRAGVTPGMGVRFDKLTAGEPAGARAGSWPTRASASRAARDAERRYPGKSGASALPVRRPSSTFSAVEPRCGAGRPQQAVAPPAAPRAAPIGGALPRPAGIRSRRRSAERHPRRRRWRDRRNHRRRVSQPSPAAARFAAARCRRSRRRGTPGAGALPTVESQSALGRLATGPNLSAFGPAVRLAPSRRAPLPKRPATARAGHRHVGRARGPTPLEDSERTQIADGLPEFANEQPTHVGGPALGDDWPRAGPRAITATSKRTPTPPPQPKLSLDEMAAPAAGAAAARARRGDALGGDADGPRGAADAAREASRPSGVGSQPVGRAPPRSGTPASDLRRPSRRRRGQRRRPRRCDRTRRTPRRESSREEATGRVIVAGVLVGAALRRR